MDNTEHKITESHTRGNARWERKISGDGTCHSISIYKDDVHTMDLVGSEEFITKTMGVFVSGIPLTGIPTKKSGED